MRHSICLISTRTLLLTRAEKVFALFFSFKLLLAYIHSTKYFISFVQLLEECLFTYLSILFIHLFFICLFIYRVSLCNHGCPGTYYINQAGPFRFLLCPSKEVWLSLAYVLFKKQSRLRGSL